MSECFAVFLSQRNLDLGITCHKAKQGTRLFFWDSTAYRHFYNLVTKESFPDKLDLSTLYGALEAMEVDASTNVVSTFTVP